MRSVGTETITAELRFAFDQSQVCLVPCFPVSEKRVAHIVWLCQKGTDKGGKVGYQIEPQWVEWHGVNNTLAARSAMRNRASSWPQRLKALAVKTKAWTWR